VKSDEVVLPQRLPPGGTSPAKNVAVDTKKKLAVHVMNANGQPMFHFMTQQLDLNGFTNMLATSVSAGQDYQVRVSYEPDVQFKDVMAIFNACAKQKISECGLIPLRGRDAVQ
jgi:biopolymer transport protein ExbD